jgi:hypothetical protein
MSNYEARQVNQRIGQHRTWLDRNPSYFEKTRQKIDEALRDPTLYSLISLSVSVAYLGSFFGTRGLVLLHEETDGWSDLSGAIEAYTWSVRLLVKAYYAWFPPERSSRRSTLIHRLPLTVCLLAHFVSTGDESRAREIWSLLQKPLNDSDPRINQWWRERHFELFFVRLYGSIHQVPLPGDASRWNLGIYSSIMENWADEGKLEAAFVEASNYHVRHMENTRDWDAEFDQPPFDLVPFELYAVNQLRILQGLPSCSPGHPLFHFIPPFLKAPEPAELSDVLSQVADKYGDFD